MHRTETTEDIVAGMQSYDSFARDLIANLVRSAGEAAVQGPVSIPVEFTIERQAQQRCIRVCIQTGPPDFPKPRCFRVCY